MKNQIKDVILDLIKETGRFEFTSREIANHCSALYLKGSPIIKTKSDYPYFKENYVASLLRNYCNKPKKPVIKRRIDLETGLWKYTASELLDEEAWLLKLWLMFYTDGDYRSIYEHEQYNEFLATFNLKTEKEVAKFLEKEHPFENYELRLV